MAEDFTETSLLLQCKGQDERRKLLADLFMKHRPRLRSMVEIRMDRRIQGRFDPSDVVQEAYLEAPQRLGEYLKNPPMRTSLTAQPLPLVSRERGVVEWAKPTVILRWCQTA